MERRIKLIESFSDGKQSGKNQDAIYVGENFVAVIDGVSHKNSILINGKPVRIADIIMEAIQKLDSDNAPCYAKAITFEEAITFINLYIKKYLGKHGMETEVGKVEATGVIYSKFHNQIWLVGDCRAIYDGIAVENPLKIDAVYIAVRRKIIEVLLREGYTKQDLIKHDISKDIIKDIGLLATYIRSQSSIDEIIKYWREILKQALLECGFSAREIEKHRLIEKYYNIRELQQLLRNNPNTNAYGYAVFNGEYTEPHNCKVVTLPPNVKTIKLFSDGFQVKDLQRGNIDSAVRKRWENAAKDRNSINQNPATHNSVGYRKEGVPSKYAIDDASAIVFEIEKVKEISER